MGNTKKIFNTKAAEEFAGKGGIAQYFKPKKKRGRPSKKSKQNKTIATNDTATKSPPTTANTTINTSSTTADIEISIEIDNNNNSDILDEINTKTATKKEEPKQHKKTRRNWGVGEDREILENALYDWNNEGESKYDDNGEEIKDYTAYANIHDIPSKTFWERIV